MKKFFGTGVALVTPFKKDLSVDVEALEKLVNYQIDNGINYLVVLGTTAESATLSKSEKEFVKETIIKTNNKRVPLVIGIGGNNTTAVIDEIKNTDLSAFDAILSVSPYYNKPSQEGLYQHFKAIAKSTDKPIILYNVPGRTAKNMEPTTVLRLANEFKNIIGIKEAAGDFVQAMKIIQHQPDNFLVISGDDMITLPMVLAGGAGVISVIAQGLPKEFSKMMQLGLDRKVDESFEIQYQIMDSIDYIFEEGNPAGIKAM
ncbi:MAG: 4-hydroxy-tetrahydrodipicolinate synthase, partial [Flavobacteriaceae bacterium]|nr:4-hydroxy-tetrahydrodipicolinate synthase [Flavobacteriaceae bacterium]